MERWDVPAAGLGLVHVNPRDVELVAEIIGSEHTRVCETSFLLKLLMRGMSSVVSAPDDLAYSSTSSRITCTSQAEVPAHRHHVHLTLVGLTLRDSSQFDKMQHAQVPVIIASLLFAIGTCCVYARSGHVPVCGIRGWLPRDSASTKVTSTCAEQGRGR